MSLTALLCAVALIPAPIPRRSDQMLLPGTVVPLNSYIPPVCVSSVSSSQCRHAVIRLAGAVCVKLTSLSIDLPF